MTSWLSRFLTKGRYQEKIADAHCGLIHPSCTLYEIEPIIIATDDVA